MIFCNVNKLYPKEHAIIQINKTELTQVNSTKFLGIIIDEGLKWFQHIDLVCKRSNKMLGILRKVCPLIHSSAHLTLQAYYSFMFPFINYCNIVWAATHPTYLIKPLIIQKRFLRMISHSHRYAPSAPLFKRYSLLPIERINTYQTQMFLHKFKYKPEDLPDTFLKKITFTTDVHEHFTRHSNNSFFLSSIRTIRHKFNLSFRGPKLWSELSLSLRSITSQSVFKKHLKQHHVFAQLL